MVCLPEVRELRNRSEDIYGMSNTQNDFGSRNRPPRLETTSQIMRRQRLNKALRKADRAEKSLKSLGITAQAPPRPRQKKDSFLKRIGKWLFQRG